MEQCLRVGLSQYDTFRNNSSNLTLYLLKERTSTQYIDLMR